jgi:hypothetical protein
MLGMVVGTMDTTESQEALVNLLHSLLGEWLAMRKYTRCYMVTNGLEKLGECKEVEKMLCIGTCLFLFPRLACSVRRHSVEVSK